MANCGCNKREYVSREVRNWIDAINYFDGTDYSWRNATIISSEVKRYKAGEEYQKISPEEKEEIGLLERACQDIIDEHLNWE